MCGERGSPGRCGWDEGREEGEKALEHALPSFRLLSLERVLVRHRVRVPRPIHSFRVLLVTRTQSTVPGPGRSIAFPVFS